MIMDRLERFRCYQRSVPELWDAVRFAERVQKEQLPPGKYPVGKGLLLYRKGIQEASKKQILRYIVIIWMYRSF